MDEYKEFAKGGEISYTGKIDSVTVFSGDGRVCIQGLIISDPKVTNCRIFWNGNKDSLNIPVVRTENVDTIKEYISLPENLYNFIIYTYDALGNKSIPVYITGRSYGDAYKASISNRLVASASVDENSDAKIVWRDIDKTLGAFTTDIFYTTNDGEQKTYQVDVDEKETILSNYKQGTNFSYQTLYRPDTLCVDTFRTISEVYKMPYKIEKNNWIAIADSYEPNGQMPIGGSPSFAIDDDYDTFWHTEHVDAQPDFPHWFAVDMKQPVNIAFIELTRRPDNTSFFKFTLQGSMDGQNWTDIYEYDFIEANGPQRYFLSGEHIYSNLRIYASQGRERWGHLIEFSVYGNSDNE
ncbi:hypothetical protein JCM30204_08970 [Dysgonomonas termitidis]